MQRLSAATFRAIATLMHELIGLALNDSKKPLVESRLATRLQRLALASYEDYLGLITDPQYGDELQVAIDLLTTNETYFFREPQHFDLLERDLVGQRPHSLTVWCAAGSFGDEAYSIAMLLADLTQRGVLGAAWSILSTDISTRVLQTAKRAIYPEERLRHVSAERLKRYCLKGEQQSEGLIQLSSRLRERVQLGQLNLCKPIESLGPFDVIFLRNVLIYFDAETKRQVVERVLTQLKPNGLFFLGTAEGRVPCGVTLQTLAPGAFRKVAAQARTGTAS